MTAYEPDTPNGTVMARPATPPMPVQVEAVPVAQPASPGADDAVGQEIFAAKCPPGNLNQQALTTPVTAGLASGSSGFLPTARGPTDRCAVASAVCGLTAIVPVVSQLAGFGFGIVSLLRIRRARRAGLAVRGTGWALTGLFSSGFALIGWIGVFLAFSLLGTSLAHSTASLEGLLNAPPHAAP